MSTATTELRLFLTITGQRFKAGQSAPEDEGVERLRAAGQDGPDDADGEGVREPAMGADGCHVGGEEDVAGGARSAEAGGVVAGEPFQGHADDPPEAEAGGGGVGDDLGDVRADEEVADGGGGPDDDYADAGSDDGEGAGVDDVVPVTGPDGHPGPR
ncbi:hypothetical protein [Streptomyces sp. NPDC056632]|uniref:hypothetical protein n=1 Tax=Streptomyces sp. NPDC056632 TaxID=3345884 RepID=UPI00368B1E5E